MRKKTQPERERGARFFGFILIMAGLIWLLHRMKIDLLPAWAVSGPVLTIILGLIFTIKTRFRKVAPILITLLGTAWLFRKYDLIPYEYHYYTMPVVLMIIGLVFLLRPRKNPWDTENAKRCAGRFEEEDVNDMVGIDAVFCGSKKRVSSKNFQGGNINIVFGGSEINLSHADFEKEAVLNVSITFGGLNLIIPSNWEVKMQMSTIAAGVEDNRPDTGLQVVPDKTLILKGNVLFGGVEIQSH
ncbi:MAG: hypothetical protein GC180_04555 [Bacteroidetes bacterium]|nr:hypothetical protein [Bacteroidota bacterium]